MPEIRRYDILILGSGEAGKYLAWTLAKAGRRTAVVERGLIGGSCPNACLPSKNIIYSAKVASMFHRGAEFGIASNSVAINMKGVRHRKRQMVEDLIAIHLDHYRNTEGLAILFANEPGSPGAHWRALTDGSPQSCQEPLFRYDATDADSQA